MWCIIVTGTDGVERLFGYGTDERCSLDTLEIRRAGGTVVYVGPSLLWHYKAHLA